MVKPLLRVKGVGEFHTKSAVGNDLQIRWRLHLPVPGPVLCVLLHHTLKPCLVVHSTGTWISSDKNVARILTPLVSYGDGQCRCPAVGAVIWGRRTFGVLPASVGGRSPHKPAVFFFFEAYKIALGCKQKYCFQQHGYEWSLSADKAPLQKTS